MFVGHLAVALGVKRAEPNVPLGAAVAAAFGLAVEEHNKLIAWQKQIIAELGKAKGLVEPCDCDLFTVSLKFKWPLHLCKGSFHFWLNS